MNMDLDDAEYDLPMDQEAYEDVTYGEQFEIEPDDEIISEMLDETATTSRYVEALAIGILPMVWRNYDVNNTYVIDEWQRVHTFEDFERKAMMLRDDSFHAEKLELARKNYAKVHLTEEEYYKEFERRMNNAI